MKRSWVITDSASSFSTSDFTIPGCQLGLGHSAFCRKTTLHGGRQEGVEIIEVSNGVVSVRVCPTRGMGIIDGRFGRNFLGWRSPVREIVHPQYIDLYDLGGRGCHYGFNELLNRCGIEWSGAMGFDEVLDNMGNRARVFLPLHGKVGWTPASRLELSAYDGTLSLEGEVSEQNVFGVVYLLKTRLMLGPGSSRIAITDTLCNLGSARGEYEMLYHTNFGPPFLESGARYYGTYDMVVPRDEFASRGMKSFNTFPGPTAGYTEQVFLFRAHADGDGLAHQAIVNASGTLAAHVSFAVETLPYTILWKRCAAESDGYVAGLNPCSDLPNSRAVERTAGRLATIAPGGEVVFLHSIEPIEGKEKVDAMTASISAVGGSQLAGKPGDLDRISKR